MAKNRAQRRAAQAGRGAPAAAGLGVPPRPVSWHDGRVGRAPRAPAAGVEPGPQGWEDRLRVAAGEVQVAQAGLLRVVVEARAGGATWAQVGAVLGITRQSAHERFSRSTAEG